MLVVSVLLVILAVSIVFMDGTIRDNISTGLHVAIVLKKDQKTGKLTTGVVQRILTNSRTHPYGIKVRLESGEIGRVKEILVVTYLTVDNK